MKTYRLSVLIVTFLLIVSSVVSLSLGWFTNYKYPKPDLGFSAGRPDDYALYEIAYDEETEKNVYTEKDTVGNGGFDISDLQFGKINNLSALSYSNYVYYAIKIPKKNGGSVSLGISYGDFDGDGGTEVDVDGDGVADGNTAHFKIYVPVRVNGDIQYTDGVMQTELLDDTAKLEKIGAIEIENSETFITYSLAFSELAPDAYTDTAALDALFEEALDDANDAKSSEKKEHQMNATGDDGAPETSLYNFDTSALMEDFYYVYIKFTPNIDLYKYFIDVLWDSMPFYLAYEVKVKLEVMP